MFKYDNNTLPESISEPGLGSSTVLVLGTCTKVHI